jgi:murein DD-endopeptidase MepM/ murein hydrolase activator NlpD
MPYINVEIVANVSLKQVVPHDTTNVVDKSIAKGSKKVKQSGKDGLAQVEEKVTILNGDVVDETVTKNTVITAAVNEVVAVGSKVTTYVASGRFIRPSRGSISSRFGYRSRGYHTGVDFASRIGTPIVAADSGKVSFVGWNGGYGRCLMINHGNGYQTLYGHTSKIYVKEGQYVKKGQVIAAVGSTGNSTGPHVHFEVRVNGVPKNPLKYVN